MQRALWVVASATLLFAAALFGLERYNAWLLTGAAAAISLTLIYFSRVWPRLRNPSGSWRDLWLGLLLGVGMIAVTHGLYDLARDLFPALARPVNALYARVEHPPGPVGALPILLLVVFAEEAVWRGVLYPALQRRLSKGKAAALTTVAYAAPQLAAPTFILLLVALACGAVWTTQRSLSDSLLQPLVTHLTWSTGMFVVLPVSPVAG